MSIHMTAYFVVRDDTLEICQKVIREFVEYIRVNEPDTLVYTSLQEKENPNHFLHYFIFKDAAARDLHSNSAAVDRLTSLLYPNLVAPVEFTGYELFTSTK
jgi:quinol monooxygenase YgiN